MSTPRNRQQSSPTAVTTVHAFMGIVRFGPRPTDESDKSALAEIAIAGRRSFTFLESDHAIFMCTEIGDDPGPPPNCLREKSGLFAGVAFLHNAKEISATLELSPPVADAILVRKIFERRHDAGLAMLRGAFTFAHWDIQARELTLARDCGQGQSLFFYRAKDLVIFASRLPDLVSHRDVPRELDEIVVASFLSHDTYQHRRTFFRDVERVPTRHAVTLTCERLVRRAYWAPQIRDTAPYQRDEDYIDRARELLDLAVARSISDEPNFAVLSSGGLDSAAIVSTLARSGRSRIPCYTILHASESAPVPAGRYADERPKTEALARMYPALHFHYIAVSELAAGDVPDLSRFVRRAMPHKHISGARIGFRSCAWLAAQAYAVRLSGGAGNIGLTWHGANLLPYLARRGRLLTLAREAHATAVFNKSSSARVLAHELFLPSLPLPLRRALKRMRSPDPFGLYGNMPLKREVVAELDLPRILDEDGFDPLYPWISSSPLERAKWLFDHNQFVHDNFSASAVFDDMEVRHPLGDRDLLEFALNVPETLYRRNGVTRWFARQVLADRVPPEILHETRRGAQNIPWFDMLNARRGEIAAEVDQMENSILASRLFDIPRLRQLIKNWPKDAQEAETHRHAYMFSLDQAVHVSQFIRWATKGNA